MKLVVGLGNPGQKYKTMRHNLGFMVVDELAKVGGVSWRYSANFVGYSAKTIDYVLLKPSTFMNKSGEAVRLARDFFKVKNRDIIAICDEVDLDFGKIRISFDSTSGGHKGIVSLIQSLGTMDFARLRIGIGHPKRGNNLKVPPQAREDKMQFMEVDKYVLQNFSDDEKEKLGTIINKSVEAAKSYIDSGIEATMNRFN